MKFALITDIHGNAPALKAVLKKIDDRKDVDHINCTGDIIAIGPDTNEVLEMLFDRSDVSMITGNHDEAVLALLKGEPYPKSHAASKKHHEWIAGRMDGTFIQKMSGLPRTIEMTSGGKKILFTHYHMDDKKKDFHISKDPFSSIVSEKDDSIMRLFDGCSQDLICFGHHHPLHCVKNESTIFLNPGVLGCHDKPTARYAMVEVNQEEIEIQLQETEYDNRAFLESYDTLQVPEGVFLRQVFHGGQ